MYKILLKKKLLHKGKNTLKLKTDDPVARMSGITLINGKTFKSSSGPYYRDHSETLLITYGPQKSDLINAWLY